LIEERPILGPYVTGAGRRRFVIVDTYTILAVVLAVGAGAVILLAVHSVPLGIAVGMAVAVGYLLGMVRGR
jgi:predicted Na+-dependent transporter